MITTKTKPKEPHEEKGGEEEEEDVAEVESYVG